MAFKYVILCVYVIFNQLCEGSQFNRQRSAYGPRKFIDDPRVFSEPRWLESGQPWRPVSVPIQKLPYTALPKRMAHYDENRFDEVRSLADAKTNSETERMNHRMLPTDTLKDQEPPLIKRKDYKMDTNKLDSWPVEYKEYDQLMADENDVPASNKQVRPQEQDRLSGELESKFKESQDVSAEVMASGKQDSDKESVIALQEPIVKDEEPPVCAIHHRTDCSCMLTGGKEHPQEVVKRAIKRPASKAETIRSHQFQNSFFSQFPSLNTNLKKEASEADLVNGFETDQHNQFERNFARFGSRNELHEFQPMVPP